MLRSLGSPEKIDTNHSNRERETDSHQVITVTAHTHERHRLTATAGSGTQELFRSRYRVGRLIDRTIHGEMRSVGPGRAASVPAVLQYPLSATHVAAPLNRLLRPLLALEPVEGGQQCVGGLAALCRVHTKRRAQLLEPLLSGDRPRLE